MKNKPDFVQSDGGLVPRAAITQVDTRFLESKGYVLLHHADGISRASHIQAFDALMLLKPSALEGLRLRYGKGTWILHNLVAHPLMQFMALGGMLTQRTVPGLSQRLFDWAMAVHDGTVPKPMGGKLFPEQEEKTQESKDGLALLVTGSVAAIKTVPLIEALRKDGHELKVILTRAPEEWKWVSPEELRAAGYAVLSEKEDLKTKMEVLQKSKAILVAPASADFISQLAHASSGLARAVLDAQRGSSRLMIAPAMNYKMWHHPAVQRNCAALAGNGVTILGPVEGPMACGDHGYGRMMPVEDITQGVKAALTGTPHPAVKLYQRALQKPDLQPFRPPENSEILVVLEGKQMEWPEVEHLVADIKHAGLTATYVLDETWNAYRKPLENLTGQEVVTNHFQQPDAKGMEHIRLPEKARYVFFPFLDREQAEAMLQGRADTLGRSIYLASKASIVARPASDLSPSILSQLQRDGVQTITHVSALAYSLSLDKPISAYDFTCG
ncbi:MAG: flavoprotein [Alphaproteobacteria bacterium]|nr:flavoprotein [Alphaproteobacteria bacterium]